ncbi:fimbrial protein [Enterobacteriaceae bacterium H18W14]|uniref:fimbrial protein n=1 Tax=Dryocola boscaweniae TaxID=2925397 RepID=UPI0022EFFFF1|nr:fimbrial protein [Dryocola boscaweniae]MCT4715249.1 fimbrial protein [Dryocola boscaweniae]
MTPVIKIPLISLLAVLSGMAFPQIAWGVSNTITVHVKVESSPCEINNGEVISVDFGDDLLTTLIDGNEYKKAISYSLDCSQGASDALKIKISGSAAAFDNAVLQTNQQDLGIALFSNSQPLPLNEWLNFDRNSQPLLMAAPVKSPGSHLKGGAFSAVATMMIDYQ